MARRELAAKVKAISGVGEVDDGERAIAHGANHNAGANLGRGLSTAALGRYRLPRRRCWLAPVARCTIATLRRPLLRSADRSCALVGGGTAPVHRNRLRVPDGSRHLLDRGGSCARAILGLSGDETKSGAPGHRSPSTRLYASQIELDYAALPAARTPCRGLCCRSRLDACHPRLG